MTQILINAQKIDFNSFTISYEELVNHVFRKFVQAATIQYSRGPLPQIQGSLVEGQSIQIQKGMVFDVVMTNNS